MKPGDIEVAGDEADDEFAKYFIDGKVRHPSSVGFKPLTVWRCRSRSCLSQPGQSARRSCTGSSKVGQPVGPRTFAGADSCASPAELMRMIPNMFYFERKTHQIHEICDWGTKRNYTHVLVLGEKDKTCNG